jgi:hypothetical protein
MFLCPIVSRSFPEQFHSCRSCIEVFDSPHRIFKCFGFLNVNDTSLLTLQMVGRMYCLEVLKILYWATRYVFFLYAVNEFLYHIH